MKIKDPTIKRMQKQFLENNKPAVINKWFEESSNILKIYKYIELLIKFNKIDVVDLDELNEINNKVIKKYHKIIKKYIIPSLNIIPEWRKKNLN